jgi:hypothetical protein
VTTASYSFIPFSSREGNEGSEGNEGARAMPFAVQSKNDF